MAEYSPEKWELVGDVLMVSAGGSMFALRVSTINTMRLHWQREHPEAETGPWLLVFHYQRQSVSVSFNTKAEGQRMMAAVGALMSATNTDVVKAFDAMSDDIETGG